VICGGLVCWGWGCGGVCVGWCGVLWVGVWGGLCLCVVFLGLGSCILVGGCVLVFEDLGRGGDYCMLMYFFDM